MKGGTRAELFVNGISSWRTADGVTHLIWRPSIQYDAHRYPVCMDGSWLRHFEGQGIGHAPITCLRCLWWWFT